MVPLVDELVAHMVVQLVVPLVDELVAPLVDKLVAPLVNSRSSNPSRSSTNHDSHHANLN